MRHLTKLVNHLFWSVLHHSCAMHRWLLAALYGQACKLQCKYAATAFVDEQNGEQHVILLDTLQQKFKCQNDTSLGVDTSSALKMQCEFVSNIIKTFRENIFATWFHSQSQLSNFPVGLINSFSNHYITILWRIVYSVCTVNSDTALVYTEIWHLATVSEFISMVCFL